MNDIRLSGFAKYGTLITVVLLLAVGALTWFIKYPETIAAQSRLTSTNAPKPIIAKINAKIIDLNRSDGDTLTKGTIIATLETTARHDEVITCAALLDSLYEQLEQANYAGISKLMQQRFNHLGELQGDYQVFIQAYIPFRDYVLGNYISKRKELLEKDLDMIRKSKDLLNERRALNVQDLGLSSTTLEKNKKLWAEKLISEQEYRQLTSQNINKQMSVPQMKSEYIDNETQVNNIQKQIVELDNEVVKQKSLFTQVTLAFKSRIEEWKNNYLIMANTEGRLAFSTFLQDNQAVEAGKTIGYILPANSSIYLEVLVPQTGFGKVTQGQVVLLRFEAYPWQEFGIVNGTISYISPIPADSGYYRAKVVLPRGLQTNYGKVIPFKEGLLAQSEIVTADLRLAENLYYHIIKQFRK